LNLYTYCGNNPTNWIDPFGLRYYPEEETRRLIAGAVKVSAEGGILRGPWKAFGAGGEFDLKILNEGDYFTLNGDLLSASEMGNYLAGYANTYNYGRRGGFWTRIAGDLFALSEFFDIRRSSPWTGYILDDPMSSYWIGRGVKDADMARLREIFGDEYGRGEEIRERQIEDWIEQWRQIGERYKKGTM